MNTASRSAKQKFALIKMVIMIVVIVGGILVVIFGYSTFIDEPTLDDHDSFKDNIKLESGTAEFRIVFNSKGGFYPGRNINPFIQLTLHEQVANSSNIQVIFYDGRIVSIAERRQLSIYNDPVILNFEGTGIELGVNMSKYVANPYLTYDFSDKYGAEILIYVQDSPKPYEKSWSNVVEIKSAEDYRDKKDKSTGLGLALMIVGITLIATAPTFAKSFEYYEEYKEHKN